ncbi:CBL-interacting serine/threonine-protein kinase 23 [Asimina triloba]
MDLKSQQSAGALNNCSVRRKRGGVLAVARGRAKEKRKKENLCLELHEKEDKISSSSISGVLKKEEDPKKKGEGTYRGIFHHNFNRGGGFVSFRAREEGFVGRYQDGKMNVEKSQSAVVVLERRRRMSGEEGGGPRPTGRTRVGRYELGQTLGEGTFAKVKFARNVETGENVAIKILDKEKVLKHKMIGQECDRYVGPHLHVRIEDYLVSDGVDHLTVCYYGYTTPAASLFDVSMKILTDKVNTKAIKIKREISTMKLIRHPNVVRMYEVMASKTKIYIVLEYVTGGELFDKITNHGRLKEDEARKYFQQLINAVDYCHSRGVFHRDLKPENLLLDSTGVLKISDFGLSALPQHVRADGLLHTTCGTPNYVAPEVIGNKGYDGAKADLWSCGVILFVLMAGYLPFEETNLMSLYKKISKADFTCPSWFSTSAKKLIKRILDPNPLTRITFPEVIENEWFKKGYKPPCFDTADVSTLHNVDAIFDESEEPRNLIVERREEKPMMMNAFELISTSQGLNLGILFEKPMGVVKRETRFASKCSASEIISKIEETAGPLGFHVKKNKYKMKLQGSKTGRKGPLSIATEIFEVAPSLYMVELSKSNGDTLEFNSFYNSLSVGLKDVVWKSGEAATHWKIAITPVVYVPRQALITSSRLDGGCLSNQPNIPV